MIKGTMTVEMIITLGNIERFMLTQTGVVLNIEISCQFNIKIGISVFLNDVKNEELIVNGVDIICLQNYDT